MKEKGTALNERPFCFGTFHLHRARKQLLESGRPVRLGSRALDLLIALVERAGEMVSREELIAFAWPRTVVEDSSLRVHVGALRKVLGDGQAGVRFIVNQPGRGYSFVAPVSRGPGPHDVASPLPVAAPHPGLPAQLMRMIGRADSLALLDTQLDSGRFVTLVGAGGIGKTTLALALAEAQGAAYPDGVRFIDLSPIANEGLIPSVLMNAVGLVAPRGDGREHLLGALRDRHMLLVFDNCEHLVGELATLIEQLLKAAPRLHVLATSREPMRAEGEWVHRLEALRAPPPSVHLTASEALRFPAVELFVERATASVDDFVMHDRDAQLVCDLCHRLDGNPLAIELAAARIDLFGLAGLSTQLDARVLDLKGGRRDAPLRHHTLASMLSWSYQLLGEEERFVLNRLAVFQGWFPLRAAVDLFAGGASGDQPSLDADDLFDAIANLVAKSLLTSDASGEVVRFRLLELTRAYALARLDRLGERALMSHRHAAQVLVFVRQASEDWLHVAKAEWNASHAWLVDDVRAALAWSFTEAGDALTGCHITAAIWPLVQMINPFDRADAVERALEALGRMPEFHPALEMRLSIALAAKLELIEGRGVDAIAAIARASRLAEDLGDPALEAEALMGVVIVSMALGDYALASATVECLASAARAAGSPVSMLIADRLGAQAWHLSGQHARSRALAERVLNHPISRGPMGTITVGLDHRISMRITLSRILWLEGFADQASALAEEAMRLAETDGPLALCQTLSLCACPVALWCGNVTLAEERVARFQSLVARHQVGGVWLPTVSLIPWWLTASAEGVTSVIQVDHLITVRAAFVTPEAAARAASGDAGWCGPELLRARAERLLAEGGAGSESAAEQLLQQSLTMAGDQQALSWQLRTATSLAALWHSHARGAEARALLAPIHGRYTEGFETADLARASDLLARL